MNTAVHPLGMPFGSENQTCQTCAWSVLRGPGPRVLRCVAAGYERVDSSWRACSKYEASLDCLDCGACCGPAFDAVEISRQDPVRRLHPERIIRIFGRYSIRRTADNHCVALQADTKCSIYADRPRCCRDFEKGSANCIFARRRAGRSEPWRANG